MSTGNSTRKLHGLSRTPEYKSYISAKARCNNPNDKRYQEYGGRGIKFEFNSFEEFVEAVGPNLWEGDTLERIRVNENYKKGNVVWADRRTQDRNRTDNRYINGKIITDISRELGLSDNTVSKRIDRYGWCIECATTLPKGQVCPHRA